MNKKHTQGDVFLCTRASAYMDIFSCMNDHTFLPTTTWLYLEIKAASHNEVCRCERHYSVVFRSPGCFRKNAISYYLTLHHQTHISISWERMATKAAFHVSHESACQGDLCFFIPVKYLSLLQSWYLATWSGGHSREEGNSVPVMLAIKNNPHTTLQWGWIVTFYSVTFSPGRSPG